VLRNGCEAHVPASQLVPGDIIALESHTSTVPADCRILVNCGGLRLDQSSLTGESMLVVSISFPFPIPTPIDSYNPTLINICTAHMCYV
jgi:P-type E1-E2 ATPase